jgi:hypothetical protein
VLPVGGGACGNGLQEGLDETDVAESARRELMTLLEDNNSQ